jgi:hypothetical protein
MFLHVMNPASAYESSVTRPDAERRLMSWVPHDGGRDPGAFGFGRVAVHLDRLDAAFGQGEQVQVSLVRVAKYE